MLGNTRYCTGITEAAMGMTVTRKGQVTIPKPVRDRLGIKPGSRVEFDIAEDVRAFFCRSGKGRVPASRFLRMRGTATSGLTTDQIMALTRGQT
jgi:AbrB family looped-hinge helix DNA binding protein